jgi:hypothetical protein
MSGVMALAAIFVPDVVAATVFGRLNVAGTTTIGTARVLGAGVVVALSFALVSTRLRWLWATVGAVGAGLTIAVGSRGPAISVMVSLSLVIVLAKVLKGRRTKAIIQGSLLVGTLAYLSFASSARASDRVVLFIAGEQSDLGRQFLFKEALRQLVTSPFGVGWGGFRVQSSLGAISAGEAVYPHNMILEVWLEGGWIAGIVFVLLIGASLVGYVRLSVTPVGAALLGLGLYWLAVAQTSSDINGNRMTWLALTVGVMGVWRANSPRSHTDGAGAPPVRLRAAR